LLLLMLLRIILMLLIWISRLLLLWVPLIVVESLTYGLLLLDLLHMLEVSFLHHHTSASVRVALNSLLILEFNAVLHYRRASCSKELRLLIPICLWLGPPRGKSNWIFNIEAAPLVHWWLVLLLCSHRLALVRVASFSRQCGVQLQLIFSLVLGMIDLFFFVILPFQLPMRRWLWNSKVSWLSWFPQRN
jgi:hypothetical protein